MREKLIELLWEYDQMRMMRMSIEECVDHLIANGVTFCDEVEELKATVVHQRKRADTAETFICTMCSECDYEVNDGILTMQKRCCSSFPECEKFKLRPKPVMTNADRIRAMTDEELAEWMSECNAYGERAEASQWLPWLEQPAEEGLQC